MKKNFYIFDSDALKNFHKRIFFSIIVFIFVYSILLYRILDVMILDKSVLLITKSKNFEERGNIYDRNNNILSTTINIYSLSTNPLLIKDKKNLSEKLSLILSLPFDEVYIKLNQNKEFVYIKRFISPKEHQKIINLGEINLNVLQEKTRIYPFSNTTSHIVGITDTEGNGLSGIERGLNHLLAQGENVHLSIDIRLQEALREEMIKTIEKFSADSGSIIVYDIKTNEILALSSFPDFNPNDKKSFNDKNLFNIAIQGNYEMGSTFKPITAVIGINENVINEEMEFDVSKPIKIGKRKISDFHPYDGNLNVKDIIVKSSNIGISKIAQKIGKKKQIEFFKKIGFYEKVRVEIEEAAMPLGNKNNWGEIETMTIGYGHGFSVTPLHLVLAYSSLINGYKSNPTFLLNKKNYQNEKIVEQETSDYFLKLLRAVVLETEYTGPRVEVKGYKVGGKTGTSMLIDKFGKYQKDSNLTSFISVFPVPEPRYVILALVENPKKIKEENYNITGASVAAPLVKQIILKMIEILTIKTPQSNEVLKADTTVKYQIMSNATF